jgi:hypothetical protein
MTADESEAIASQLSRARRTDEKNHIASCLGQPATKVTTRRTGVDDKAVVGGTKQPTRLAGFGQKSGIYWHSISNEGARINSYVAPQDPTDAQWPRNGRITMLEYEKVKIT